VTILMADDIARLERAIDAGVHKLDSKIESVRRELHEFQLKTTEEVGKIEGSVKSAHHRIGEAENEIEEHKKSHETADQRSAMAWPTWIMVVIAGASLAVAIILALKGKAA